MCFKVENSPKWDDENKKYNGCAKRRQKKISN